MITSNIKECKKLFKNHEVEFKKIDGIQIIDFRDPETIIYSMRIIIDGNKIYITGDVGSAIYNLTWNPDIVNDNWDDIDIDYFSSKLDCSKRSKYIFDEETAIDNINYRFKELLEQEYSDKEINTIFNFKNFNRITSINNFLDDVEIKAVLNDYIKIRKLILDCDTNEEFNTRLYTTEFLYLDEYFGDFFASLYNCGKTLSPVMYCYLAALQSIHEKLVSYEGVSDER